MKMMMMKTMMMISMMTLMMKSPMSMVMTLLAQTLLTIILTNSINNNSWIPLITFLTMIGGLLIIFMYMSSITSNDKFKMNMKICIPMIMMIIMTEDMMLNFEIQETQDILLKTNKMMSLTKMYSKMMMMTTMLILYLMLTMITVNKIIKLFEGPLRSKT
uniref:NADH dehydrogenase subunit 6 n=1 Tax=Choucentrus sinensis TaxID=3038122 RepID=UPI00315D2D45